MRLITLFIGILLFAGMPVKSQGIASWKMEEVVKSFKNSSDSIYVINFWATFCKPCVAEIPYLQKIALKYKGRKVRLLLVSLDMQEYYPEKIAAFAKKSNIQADIVWLNETNADHFCPMIDKTWSGSIPATLFVNAKTGYKKFFEEEMKEDQFEIELLKSINDK